MKLLQHCHFPLHTCISFLIVRQKSDLMAFQKGFNYYFRVR